MRSAYIEHMQIEESGSMISAVVRCVDWEMFLPMVQVFPSNESRTKTSFA